MTPRGWFLSRHVPTDETNGRSSQLASSRRNNSSPRRNKKRHILSQSMVIDIDPNKRSDQAETAILHHDIIHNPSTVFHFELQWIGTTARIIEDQLRIWSRTIDRYGLKLVEAFVTQINDVRDRNAFQSCFPMRLCVAPPEIPDLEKRIPEGMTANCYFEYALLNKFGFILDIEAANLYPPQVDVVYSYRRSVVQYSQFVHRSGVAFVQVLGGEQGFVFLTNRLMGPGRMGSSMKSREQRPSIAAEEIRVKLTRFCEDQMALRAFYDEEVAALKKPVEEPPELNI
jgi:DEP domain-containing protein 5